MLHYAGVDSGANWYYSKVASIDFDYIGLSYYPLWHGKDLNSVKIAINVLSQTYNKKVLIAETSYPFTFNWNDYTTNVLGSSDQIIPAYPASASGQKNYLIALKSIIKETANGIGFCYWGGEWVAFRGPTSTNGSSFENQALWDFNTNALPVMEAFGDN
jgi:arabinogalactan endo-1,4-beta-galactosidase